MSLELNGIITIDKLARYHEKIAAKYASTSDLENYATEEYVDEAIANSVNVNVYEITSDSAVLDELVALLPEGIEIPLVPYV